MGQVLCKSSVRRAPSMSSWPVHLSSSDLSLLRTIFDHVSASRSDDGLIDEDEFRLATGSGSEMAGRLFRVFSANDQKDKGMTFQEFADLVSSLCERSSLEQRCWVCFKCFDANGDGFLELQEIVQLVEACISGYIEISTEQVQRICEHSLAMADINADGVISFQEFRELVYKTPRLVEPLTISLDAVRNRAMELEKMFGKPKEKRNTGHKNAFFSNLPR